MHKNELENVQNMNELNSITGYNETKERILSILEHGDEGTTMEIAEITGKRYENISMCCMEYFRQGLLHRRSLKGRAFAYSISQRGLERLEWLRARDD